MVWQELYGRCWDNICGDGHTSSRRGKVNSVGLDCKTNYGKCVQVGVGYYDGKEKVDKPDLRKIKKEDREDARKKFEDEVNKQTKIEVNVYLMEDKHFTYTIDGVEVDKRMVSALRNEAVREFIKGQELVEDI